MRCKKLPLLQLLCLAVLCMPAITSAAGVPPPPLSLFDQLKQQVADTQQKQNHQQQGAAGQGSTPSQAPPKTPNSSAGQGPPPTLFEQLQQQLAAQAAPQNRSSNSNSSSGSGGDTLKPGTEFVTISQQQRTPGLAQAATQQKQQQQQQSSQVPPAPSKSSQPFQCGKPYQPCGSSIPEGASCKNGPGWCQAGYFCGFEATNTEPSRCLPLPQDCGKAGKPCCPSNTDSPHTSLEDKLNKKPFCKDGSICFYYAPEPGLNNGDIFAANKGAYACTAVAPDCGSAPGKPCCPWADKIATNPRLNNTGCSGSLYCNYDMSPVLPAGSTTAAPAGSTTAAAAPKSEYLQASASGTCEANTADCGQFGRSCCIFTSPWATSVGCGAKWNETGQRGYCADPFDGNSSYKVRATSGRRMLLNSDGSGGSSSGDKGSSGGSSGGSNGGSSSGGSSSGSSSSGGGRRASLKQLVCTPCPPRTESVADNPNKYWPC